MLAMGTLPLQASAVATLTAQGRRGGGTAASEPPPLGAPPTLPDKANFPDLGRTYMDSAASHPMSQGSRDLVRKAFAAQLGEADGFRPDQDRIRGHFARLINADPTEIALVPSTQIGESFIAAALGLPARGAHVVSDHLHFQGSQMMYIDMQQRGLEVTWVPIKENRIRPEDIDKAIRKGRTRLVAISAASFVTGFMHDLKRVAEIAHAKGAMVHVDAIQATGSIPLDVKESGIDSLCAATYKWMMSSGTAFLYVRKESQARMQPPFYHWSRDTYPQGQNLAKTHMYPFDEPIVKEIVDSYWPKEGAPGMFSLGYTPNLVTLAGLEYSLPYIMNIGVGTIQAHAQAMVRRLKEELPKRGYTLLTPVENNPAPIVSVAVKDAPRLAPTLTAAGVRITTRWNHVRIAPSVFNDMDDVERVLNALPRA
jgi:selenocysteine lyase/cysteine desulfurase